MKSRGIFITATDTDAGKTVASLVLGLMLQKQGLDVGVMKPVQCAGNDAAFLKKHLGLRDKLQEINPYYAKYPVSPHVAFAREQLRVDIHKIKKQFDALSARHDFMIVEGAGGLMAPITNNYLIADLIKELGLDVVVVSRLSLGTINHTLLTVAQARHRGLDVRGVLFNQTEKKFGLPEKTNPEAVRRMGHVAVLGTIPYLPRVSPAIIQKICFSKIHIEDLLVAQAQGRSRALKHDDKKYVWHPFTQMKDWLSQDPLIIQEAKGCYLKDADGRWYLDGISSLWVNVHGHRHPDIDAAIGGQINRVSHSTLLGLSNVPSIELARELVRIAPKGLEKVFYSDSGSTAVEVALKIAYQYWQNRGATEKKKIVHFAHSYHGDTLGSVSVGGIDLFHKVYRDLIFDTVSWPTPYPDAFGGQRKFVKEFNSAIKALETFFKKKHAELAALIVEPLVQGAAGMIVWPKGVLKQVARLCARYNVLLICDEVATGFGRTGTMFACNQEDVSPDILCLAKGLTAGYLPLAATLTTQRIYDGFLFDYREQKTFFHGHTYTGNPLACAAALANLKVFKKEKTLMRLQPKIETLRTLLEAFKGLDHVGDIRQKGFMVGIELVKDKKKRQPYLWQEKIGIRVCHEARKHGVLLRPLGSTIVLMPPLSITVKELTMLCKAATQAIQTVTENHDES